MPEILGQKHPPAKENVNDTLLGCKTTFHLGRLAKCIIENICSCRSYYLLRIDPFGLRNSSCC